MSLLEFVCKKMKMSHVYQPVMIKTLLENNGIQTVQGIAEQLLKYDQSQIEYYINVTKNMVGKVLLNHQIVEKEKDIYKLREYDKLSQSEKEQIIDECNKKIVEYITKRGINIWEHRRKNRRSVPGTVRYEVLKRAKYRCELCGISAEEKALEVDHITPKNLGGEDSINNYQALCYTCNAQKKDLDDTSFREQELVYHARKRDCIFCDLENRKILLENNLAHAFFDKFPVTKLHILITPKRHASNYFDLNQAEINAINSLIHHAKDLLIDKDPTIEGFNIGINNGTAAGQTIFHCHIHLIPRRKGDVDDPTGGVRNIIPGKGKY